MIELSLVGMGTGNPDHITRPYFTANQHDPHQARLPHDPPGGVSV